MEATATEEETLPALDKSCHAASPNGEAFMVEKASCSKAELNPTARRKIFSSAELEELEIEAKRMEVKKMMERNRQHMQKHLKEYPGGGAAPTIASLTRLPTPLRSSHRSSLDTSAVQRQRQPTCTLARPMSPSPSSPGRPCTPQIRRTSGEECTPDQGLAYSEPMRTTTMKSREASPHKRDRTSASSPIKPTRVSTSDMRASPSAGKDQFSTPAKSHEKIENSLKSPARLNSEAERPRSHASCAVQPPNNVKRAASAQPLRCAVGPTDETSLSSKEYLHAKSNTRSTNIMAASALENHACATSHEWPSDTWLKWSLEVEDEDVGVQELFERFRTSRETHGIAEHFAKLLRGAVRGLTQPYGLPVDAIQAAVGTQKRHARVLWERLGARQSAIDYTSSALRGHRAVIVGAGPVGLRCALELKLLGADVVVLEKRTSFDRINRLHLWPWVGEDLKRWGAKVFEPPELSFGADPDFLHIGICELQMLLLKPCLLLGVQVFFGVEYLDTVPVKINDGELEMWEVIVKTAHDQGVPGPSPPKQLRGATILIGADGPQGSVAHAHAFQRLENTNLRKEAALGLVVNFTNRQTPAEKRRRSFSLARQFYEPLFQKCEERTGVVLENIVNYISPHAHYFVMTPTRGSLVQAGVLPAEAEDIETSKYHDVAALVRVARALSAFPWKTDEAELPDETLESPIGMPSLFDFSRTRRAAAGLRVVESSSSPSSNCIKPARLLVGLCGDALIEPFWPEGLGIVRGFFAALDMASATKLWAETGDGAVSSAHFMAAYQQLKSLTAKTRDMVLRPEESGYSLDPKTRYRWIVREGPKGQVRASSLPASKR